MGLLLEADLGSWCACERVPTWGHLKCPNLGSPFRRSPRAVCTVELILEILCCDPKGHRASLRIPSTEGRGVRLCWALSKPRGLKWLARACRWAMLGGLKPKRPDGKSQEACYRFYVTTCWMKISARSSTFPVVFLHTDLKSLVSAVPSHFQK